MRVMIVGQKWLGAEVLKLCLQRGDDVAAVSTPRVDDRLAALAAEHGIALCQVEGRLDAGWVPEGVDLILCAHAHAYITAAARAKTRLGALGYHPSLLPRHRGRDAVHWATHMRDLITGGSVYWMDDGADTGPIAAQDWCWIQPGDTAEELWRRDLGPMGPRLLADVLRRLDAGEVPMTPQLACMASWEPSVTSKRLGS